MIVQVLLHCIYVGFFPLLFFAAPFSSLPPSPPPFNKKSQDKQRIEFKTACKNIFHRPVK